MLRSAALAVLAGSACAQTIGWLTRPGQQTVPLVVETNKLPATESKEYLFLAPFQSNTQWYGPHMYDANGELVWYGGDVSYVLSAINLHVSLFNGKSNLTHLVFYNGVGGNDQVFIGTNQFLDQSYNPVASYGSVGDLPRPDFHETTVVANTADTSNSLIYDSYPVVVTNLSAYGGPKRGQVFNPCFQDLNLSSKELILQWCATDHVPFNQSYTPPGTSGAGKGTEDSLWDYFQLTGIDKTPTGDYLVSARGTSTIYKVAGANSTNPGSIQWRLGGRSNDFTMVPSTFNFSFQNDIRYHGTKGSISTFTLLNNAYNGYTKSAAASSGLLFTVNEETMVATLQREYVQPRGRLASSMGNVQIMNNNNIFIGWGSQPSMSEMTPDGELLFYAHIGPANFTDFNIINYRAYKAPWVGKPTTVPAVLAYRRTCRQAKSFVYVSWNGATNVASYTLALSNSSTSGWVQHGGKIAKTGYETMLNITSHTFSAYAQVTAYDATGAALSTSAPSPFFVPHPRAQRCNIYSCGTDFRYEPQHSVAGTCLNSSSSSSL